MQAESESVLESETQLKQSVTCSLDHTASWSRGISRHIAQSQHHVRDTPTPRAGPMMRGLQDGASIPSTRVTPVTIRAIRRIPSAMNAYRWVIENATLVLAASCNPGTVNVSPASVCSKPESDSEQVVLTRKGDERPALWDVVRPWAW